MDTINTNQIEIGGKLLNIEPKKLNGNVQINLTGDVSGSIDTPIEAGKTITIETRVEGGTGGGIPEAPIDDKQYARKNAGWVEVEGGGGEPEIFKIIPGIEDLGIDPTPFTDILEASRAGKYLVVECGIEGIYILNGTVTNFNYDEDDQTGGLQCVVSMEAPEYYMTPVKYICDLAYDASAATTDTWTVSEPLNIMSPSSTSRDGMVPTLQTLYEDRKVISWKLPTVVEVENLSTTPYTDVANIMAHGSSPVYWELGTLYLYLGIGTVDSATGYVFGSIRQEDDGTLYMQKRVAKSDETWYAPSTHFPIGGGGGASAFKAIYGTTSYAEVLAAINADSIVICDVSGYIYQYVNKDSTKIVFALTEKNSSGNVMNETVWVNSDDTWDGEAIRVAKHSEVPTLTSQLTNDAGFSKVVVGNAPPAAGTPDDTITLILGGAGGAGEYGAWELIGEGTGLNVNSVITLSKSIRDYDFIIVEENTKGASDYNRVNASIIAVNSLKFTGTDLVRINQNSGNSTGANFVTFQVLSETSLKIQSQNFYTGTEYTSDYGTRVYGINLKGSKKENVEEFSIHGKVDTDLLCSANHKIEIDFYMDASVISSINAGVMLSSTRTSDSTVASPDFCLYQGKLYFTIYGTKESNVSISNGWHSLVVNDESGKTTLDGTTISSSAYSPNNSRYYILNCRGTQSYYPNILPYKKIKITDKSTSQVVLDVECFDKDGFRYIVDKYHHINAIVR